MSVPISSRHTFAGLGALPFNALYEYGFKQRMGLDFFMYIQK